jgi:hypothetical protein
MLIALAKRAAEKLEQRKKKTIQARFGDLNFNCIGNFERTSEKKNLGKRPAAQQQQTKQFSSSWFLNG